ncbi:hypothetical protein AMECASPLE_039634 [Ameca splendens]|uniref:Uncharacterized protein n=1 Tax=Ameca splendens TaxID=208324 RepID=A0ABV1AEW7_9TELE
MLLAMMKYREFLVLNLTMAETKYFLIKLPHKAQGFNFLRHSLSFTRTDSGISPLRFSCNTPLTSNLCADREQAESSCALHYKFWLVCVPDNFPSGSFIHEKNMYKTYLHIYTGVGQ